MFNCTNYSHFDPETYSPQDIFTEYSFHMFNKKFLSTSFAMKNAFGIVWFIVGLFGNYLSYRIWSTPKIRRDNSSAIYLVALSISDMAFLVLNLTDLVHSMAETKSWKDTPGVCELYNIIILFTQYYPVMLICAFSMERYVAIRFPFHRDKLCTQGQALRLVLILGLINLVFSLASGLMWSVEPGSNTCDASRFTAVYLYPIEILISFVLPLGTFCVNALLILELRRIASTSCASQSYRAPKPECAVALTPQESLPRDSRPATRNGSTSDRQERRKEGGETLQTNQRQLDQAKSFRSTTVMLLSVSFFLILTVLPVSIVWSLQVFFDTGNPCLRRELMPHNPEWQNYFLLQNIKAVVDALLICHYACNFIIYTLTSPIFRSEAVKRLTCGKYHVPDSGYAPQRVRSSIHNTSRSFSHPPKQRVRQAQPNPA